MNRSKLATTVQERIDDLSLKIDQLDKELRHAGDEVSIESERALQELKRKRSEVQERFDALASSGDEAMDEALAGMRSAWSELKQGVERASRKLN